VLGRLPKITNENVLVGFDTADDAGVYRLSPDLALVQTVDFFTPIVDEPFLYGQIAAANSLSDVYAMGGRPLSALSIAAFPGQGDPEVFSEIMQGGLKKLQEADCVLLGGHSIADEELKFGYAITGVVHPDRVWRNAGARAGDELVFTKQLGTGVISTALKRGLAREEHVAAAVASMLSLNRKACEILQGYPVHACTDVTGFGLLGHAREMALASAVTLEIHPDQVEFLPGALDYTAKGALSGGLKNNREYIACAVHCAITLGVEMENLLYDPQTSGGLLISVDKEAAEALTNQMRQAGIPASRIGAVRARDSTPLRLS